MEDLISELESTALRKATGLVYSPNHVLHADQRESLSEEDHIESPVRVTEILKHLTSKGIVDRCDYVEQYEPVDMGIVATAHGAKYADYITHLWPDKSKKNVKYVGDTYINKGSVLAARYAAQGAVIAVDSVASGRWQNAFALIRPPGHHAGVEGKVAGFCLINNIVVAAKYLQMKYGTKRIAILDWDVHHGDSTQKLTYDDPSILFISIHRYCNGNFYPYKATADETNLGSDKGLGFNLNFPFNPDSLEVQLLGCGRR